MTLVKLAVGAFVLGAATLVAAQEPPVRVWGVRVLATDVEALATFYAKTFGLSEVARPVNSATSKEVILNVGATPDLARRATTAPVVIFTRPASRSHGVAHSQCRRSRQDHRGSESERGDADAWAESECGDEPELRIRQGPRRQPDRVDHGSEVASSHEAHETSLADLRPRVQG